MGPDVFPAGPAMLLQAGGFPYPKSKCFSPVWSPGDEGGRQSLQGLQGVQARVGWGLWFPPHPCSLTLMTCRASWGLALL